MLGNPYVRALAGGLGSALVVAGPLVDDGVLLSEAISIALAFLTGAGLTSVPSGRTVVADTVAPVGVDGIENVNGRHEA